MREGTWGLLRKNRGLNLILLLPLIPRATYSQQDLRERVNAWHVATNAQSRACVSPFEDAHRAHDIHVRTYSKPNNTTFVLLRTTSENLRGTGFPRADRRIDRWMESNGKLAELYFRFCGLNPRDSQPFLLSAFYRPEKKQRRAYLAKWALYILHGSLCR